MKGKRLFIKFKGGQTMDIPLTSAKGESEAERFIAWYNEEKTPTLENVFEGYGYPNEWHRATVAYACIWRE